MAKWNPLSPSDWARVLGLVALPYFGLSKHAHAGAHQMMQDGEAASFALHIVSPEQAATADQTLGWAWSSNVRCAVNVDPQTGEAVIRQWDDPSRVESLVVASEQHAQKVIDIVEGKAALVIGSDVISRALEVFSEIRTAIEQRGGVDRDVVLAFNSALLIAEQWHETPRNIPEIQLGAFVDQMADKGRAGFLGHNLGVPVWDYPVGEYAKLLLERKEGGAPYLLHPELLIRHASGRLNQEAHRKLRTPVGTVQWPLFPEHPLALSPDGKRLDAPKDVHHTPTWLARALVELALKHFGDQARAGLTILDPACGSGVFLIEMARELECRAVATVHLRGMDVSKIAEIASEFSVGEAIRNLENTRATLSIQGDVDSLGQADWGKPNIVLMNPPFKAWEGLGQSERDAVKRTLMGLAAGRPDMSAAFVVRAAQSLSDGGVLASIVPASFLRAKTNAKIRKHLNSGQFRLRAVGLLRGFETFGAQVQAAFIVVARSSTDSPVLVFSANRHRAQKGVRRLRYIAPNQEIADQGFEIFHAPTKAMQGNTWVPLTRANRRFVKRIAAHTQTVVSDFFAVHLGVRGIGAKGHEKILLLNETQYSEVAPTDAERRFFRPVADNIENGRICKSGYVFYPYGTDGELLLSSEGEVATALPIFYQKVLLPAKMPLEERKSRYREWWEPSRPVATWLAAHAPRIVSQAYGKSGNFAFDETGRYAVVAGHGWCWKVGTPNTDVMLAYLALLNSRVFERLLSVNCRVIEGPEYELAANFVHRIPLPDLMSRPSRLIAIGKRIHKGRSYDEDTLNIETIRAYGAYAKSDPVSEGVSSSETKHPNSALQDSFVRLAKTWRKETAHLSSARKMAQHPAYREIVSMGVSAIPLILGDLRRRVDHWFFALQEISGTDPVLAQQRGDIKKMARAWIEWGIREGYIT